MHLIQEGTPPALAVTAFYRVWYHKSEREVAPHPRKVHGSGWDVESSSTDLHGRLLSEDALQNFGSRAFCWAVCRRCTAELRLAGITLASIWATQRNAQ